MAKAYELHDNAYRQLRREKKRSWAELPQKAPPPIVDGLDTNDERFFMDVLDQPWAPRKGKYLELGCGTGPMTRWFCRKGFSGIGVDVSATAIQMAKEQSKGLDVRFRAADVTCDPLGKPEQYDLILDGRCLHCLTDSQDRSTALKAVRSLLKPTGVFVILSMCGPVNHRSFARLYPDQKLLGRIIYAGCGNAAAYAGGRTIRGKGYVPVRYVPGWQGLLEELRKASFFPQLVRLHHRFGDEVTGFMYLACLPMTSAR